MTTARLEAFSDGIFAIAATLLVLELHVPPPDQDGQLLDLLLHQWPTYATYVVSFVTIGIMWVNHHALFAHVHSVDRPLLFLNLLLLLAVAVVPFPTALLATYILSGRDSHVAAAVYGGLMTFMGVAFNLLWRYVTRRGGLLARPLSPDEVQSSTRLFSLGLGVYAAGIVIALFSAPMSLLLYAATALYYVFPWLPGAKEASGAPE